MCKVLDIYVKTIFFIFFFGNCFLSDVLCGTKCLKNEGIGDHPGNVYYCNNPDEPDCCEEDQQFKCCESKVNKTLREQAILFGSLGGAIILIVVAFVCIMKDVQCCSSKKPLKERCCPGCYTKNGDDEEEYMPSEEYKTRYKPFHHRGSIYSNDDDLKIRPESTCSTLAAGSWHKYY